MINGLKENQFDLIFCTAISSETQIEFVPVFEQLLVAAVPVGHRFACRKSIHIQELEPENIIIHTRSSSYISMGYRKHQARPYMAEQFRKHIMDAISLT